MFSVVHEGEKTLLLFNLLGVFVAARQTPPVLRGCYTVDGRRAGVFVVSIWRRSDVGGFP